LNNTVQYVVQTFRRNSWNDQEVYEKYRYNEAKTYKRLLDVIIPSVPHRLVRRVTNDVEIGAEKDQTEDIGEGL